jgi:hypothetical protein
MYLIMVLCLDGNEKKKRKYRENASHARREHVRAA